MIAEMLLDRLTRSGVSVALDGDELLLRPAHLLDDATVSELRGYKPELLAELRRRASSPPGLSISRSTCRTCGRIDRGFDGGDGHWTCWRCTEWRVEGCPTYVVARKAEPLCEKGACLACGGTWELHGRPDRAAWQIVPAEEVESVPLREARFIIAERAASNVFGTRR